MINISILEDNMTQLQYYETLIQSLLHDEVITMRTFHEPQAFLFETEWLETLDILLLDIHFEKDNGIEMAIDLKRKYPHIVIIFISAYIEYAPQVYDVDHVYFILKQQVEYRLPKAIETALKQIRENEHSFVSIQWKNSVYKIPLQELLYVERNLRKCKFVTTTETYDMYTKMEDVEKMISKQNFIRVHHSYIVNLEQVKEFHRTYFIMKNGFQISISRSYEKAVKEAILKELDATIV